MWNSTAIYSTVNKLFLGSSHEAWLALFGIFMEVWPANLSKSRSPARLLNQRFLKNVIRESASFHSLSE